MAKKSNKNLYFGVAIVIIAIIALILVLNQSNDSSIAVNQDMADGSSGAAKDNSQNNDGSSGATEAEWANIQLKDVLTGETFKISDFKGKPILIESFAVWCPTCTRQQQEIKKLHDDLGTSVISISLDTDPNEDEQTVRSHIQKNGFNWRYAISPIEMTQSLREDFGTSIINAPSAPVILICGSGEIQKLKSGIKTSEFLKSQITSC